MSAEKPFDPTPARRERAKREGNVARSTEIAGLAAFLAAGVAAYALARPIAALASAAIVAAAHGHAAAGPLAALAACALVPAGAAVSAAAVSTAAQAGGIRFAPVRFGLQRLHAGRGAARMIGGEAAVGGARAALAFAAAGGALLPLAGEVLGAAAHVASPGAAAALTASAALRAGGAAAAAAAVFAVADYALARRRWLRGLRMSLEELKREHRENEGDPQAKARRSALHRSLARTAVGRTREAAFVVVNPTHIAIALAYAPPEIPVPRILVRAAEAQAQTVRTIATEHRIPIVEDIPLARALYAIGEAGHEIPPDAFIAVAQIVASLTRENVL